MSAAKLISSFLTNEGVNNYPDLRNANQTASAGCVYEVKSSDYMETLNNTLNGIIYYKSTIDLIFFSNLLLNAMTAANSTASALNGQTYSDGSSHAFMMSVTGLSEGYIEDSRPGGVDKTRSVTLTITMFHYET
ncbi:hypothetical protein UFOVP1205_10 [uncultured Caudovirales phage]|uniref:Uncharacterized protein n=1 Tax=uncultured Caudovirales phage TaxID=2100421 RepID=A0A6J5R4V9_9CAUD|nr:hypothetical protein UFOVP1205_10 [uncultured Caudovirales phage]